MNNKITNILAVTLLSIMFLLSVFSMKDDALTFDELAHIPAGYSYLKYQDYRINPEHPPLVKSFSGIPLMFRDINFPENSENWRHSENPPAWWVQFDLGNEFIYHSGNNPKEIIFWSRIPMILLLMALGWMTFKWARELGGNNVAIGTLTLFSFSTTLIAHGRLVTTDVGAALGAVIATYFWIKFLQKPDLKNVLFAGIAFGFAMLLKFSLILLVPFFVIISAVYPLIFFERERFKMLSKYLALSLLAGVVGMVLVVYPVYALHVKNYPIEQQVRDTKADLEPNPIPVLRDATIWMSGNEMLRPMAQYSRGVLMATQRTAFGNTVFFLGEMSAKGWWYYFPVIYLLKETIALHLLTLIAFIPVLYLVFRERKKLSEKIEEYFIPLSFLLFMFIYWAAAIQGNLNIGARHLIPTLPFLFILIAMGIKRLTTQWPGKKGSAVAFISFALLGWYIACAIGAYPHYISYYNYLGGGPERGYLSAVDSNYDWGQDFYRLMDIIEEREIDQIHIDYFGGEDPEYWLGDKYVPLNPKRDGFNPNNIKGWVAVSTNELMGGLGEPVPEFDQQTGYYEWIQEHKLVDRAGKSIFVFYVE